VGEGGEKSIATGPSRGSENAGALQQDTDFAHVRGDAIAKLPEDERAAWRKLWADVGETLRQLRGKSAAAQQGEGLPPR